MTHTRGRSKPVIAIDGPAGAGKSTLARQLAARLGLLYIDTGAMYRAVAWRALQEGTPVDDAAALGRLARGLPIRMEPRSGGRVRVFLGQRDVTSVLRSPEVTAAVPAVSKHPEVRQPIVALQRRWADSGGVVVDGRDVGTHVLPKADRKFFVTASLDVRAGRRWRQMRRQGHEVSAGQVRRDMGERDRVDSTRETAPLRQAADAVVIDTTHTTVRQALARMEASVADLLEPECIRGDG